jgi:UrcA family protein
MNNSNSRKLLAVLAIVALSSPALANTKSSARNDDVFSSVSVSYTELQLSEAKGAVNVYRSLRNAAEQVCGRREYKEPLGIRAKRTECFNDVVGNAVERIGHPTMAKLHNNP